MLRMRKKVILTGIFAILFLFVNMGEIRAAEGTNEYGYIVSGDYTYEIKSDGNADCAFLHDYTGNETVVNIPSEIDGYTVRGLETMVFLDNMTMKQVHVPETINSIAGGAFATAYALEEISLERESAAGFHVTDGVLYNGRTIIAYPAAKKDSSYEILNGTITIQTETFYGCSNLEKITIPASVQTICGASFARCGRAMDIVIKRDKFSDFYLDEVCWDMAAGTRFLVKSEEAKDRVLQNMSAGEAYRVEVGVTNIPAEGLAFLDGSASYRTAVDYDKGARHSLGVLYKQIPADTTENVTWEVVDGMELCSLSGEGNEILRTMSGGKVKLEGTDESGHKILLELDIVNPMESFELSVSQAGSLKVGDSNRIGAVISPDTSYAFSYGVKWESSDESIVSARAYGTRTATLTGVSPGTAEITATVNDCGTLISKSAEIQVFDSLKNCTIDQIPAQIYKGTQLRPKPVVRYKGKVLKEGADYEITGYADNNFAGENVGAVYINGCNTTFLKENFLFAARFDIIDGTGGQEWDMIGGGAGTGGGVPGGGSDATGNGDKDHAGGAKKEITGVRDSYTKVHGGKGFVLKAKAPHAVTYESSDKRIITVGRTDGKVTIKNIGKAVVTIKAGELTKKVTIKVIPKKVASLKGKAANKSARLSWKRAKGVSGYQIQRASDKKFSKDKKSAAVKGNKTTAYTAGKLKSGKRYFVRVRAYKKVNGKKYYGEWSKRISVKIK